MKKMILFLVSILLSFSVFSFEKRFDTMVIFGDSISDTGNLYAYMMHWLPASPPYFEGRFSNGPLWIEYLFDNYFAQQNPTGFQNYAVGGAGAVLATTGKLPFSLTVEINNYLYWHTFGRKNTTLYTLWIGANNYLNGPTNVETITNSVVASISQAIESLIAVGGNKFLIANIPDLGKAPEVIEKGNPGLQTYLTQVNNIKLAEAITHLQKKYPQVLIIYFDAYTFFEDVMTHAEDYGFMNIKDPCYLGGYMGERSWLVPTDEMLWTFLLNHFPITMEQWKMIQSSPELHEAALVSYQWAHLKGKEKNAQLQCLGYFFWDHIHPTTAVHHLVSFYLQQKIDEAGLQAVLPEEAKQTTSS